MFNPLFDALKKEGVDAFHHLIVESPNLAIQHFDKDTVSLLKKHDYPHASQFILYAYRNAAKMPRPNLSCMINYSVFSIRHLLERKEFPEASSLLKLTFDVISNLENRTFSEEASLFDLHFEMAYYQFYQGLAKEAAESLRKAFTTRLRLSILVTGDEPRYFFRVTSTILNAVYDKDVCLTLYDSYIKLTNATISSAIGDSEKLSMPELLSTLNEFQSTMERSMGQIINFKLLIDFIESKVSEPTISRKKLAVLIILHLNSMIIQRTQEPTELEKQQESIRAKMCCFLFDLTPNVDFSGRFGFESNLLTKAFQSPYTCHIAAVMIQCGAHIHYPVTLPDKVKVSLVSMVASVGNLAGVKLLMENGVDPNATPHALTTAILSNQEEVALYLAEHPRVDVNCIRNNMSPLGIAKSRHMATVVKVLEARGTVDPTQSPPKAATPNKKSRSVSPDTKRRRELREHIRKNEVQFLRLPEMRQFILSPASIDPTTGSHPIHIACELGSHRALECLVDDIGVDIKAVTPLGNTALHIACEKNFYTAIRFLVCHKAPTDTKNLDDKTPSHLANAKGREYLCPKPVVTKRTSPTEKKKKEKMKPRNEMVTTTKPKVIIIPDLVFQRYVVPENVMHRFQSMHKCLWHIRECLQFYKGYEGAESLCRKAIFPWLKKFFETLALYHHVKTKPRIPYLLLESSESDPTKVGDRCSRYLLHFFSSQLSLTKNDELAIRIVKLLTEDHAQLCTERWVEALLRNCEDALEPFCDLTPFLTFGSNGNSADRVVESRLC